MLETILLALVCVSVLMLLFWFYYLQKKNPGVVDFGWVLGLLLCGNIYLFHVSVTEYTVFFAVLLYVWAFRLGGYLFFTRIRPNIVEKRYLKISDEWKIKKSLGFLINYQFQACLIIVIALSLCFIGNHPHQPINSIDYLAAVIILIGIVGEGIADFQLYKFKQKNPGKLCNVGLWNYSRHPNYFFEWLVWLGFSIAAVSDAQNGHLAFVSPLLLLAIMVFVTGPITERSSIDSKGKEYENYQKSTSMFFPWFKSKK